MDWQGRDNTRNMWVACRSPCCLGFCGLESRVRACVQVTCPRDFSREHLTSTSMVNLSIQSKGRFRNLPLPMLMYRCQAIPPASTKRSEEPASAPSYPAVFQASPWGASVLGALCPLRSGPGVDFSQGWLTNLKTHTPTGAPTNSQIAPSLIETML